MNTRTDEYYETTVDQISKYEMIAYSLKAYVTLLVSYLATFILGATAGSWLVIAWLMREGILVSQLIHKAFE